MNQNSSFLRTATATLLMIVVTTYTAFAQLTGTYTIDPSGSGSQNFTGFAQAVAALNAQGVGNGGVVFDVAAGSSFDEAPLTINVTTSVPSATRPVVFKKAGTGADPVINCTGTSSVTDAAVMLVGTDYITFDRIAINDAGTTASDWTEFGFYLVRSSATDGCQHVNILNCNIDLTNLNTASAGIYMRNADAASATLEATSADGQFRSNRFDGNVLTDVWGGIRAAGSAIIAFPDEEIRIGDTTGNTITFGGNATSASPYGIITSVGKNLVIARNNVSTITGTTANNTYGIRTLSAFDGYYKVHDNVVSVSADAPSFGSLLGIYVSPSGDAGDTLFIYNNIVQNCTVNPGEGPSSVDFRGIKCGSGFGTLLLYNNKVRNNIQNSATGTNPPLPCPAGINYDGGNNFIGILVSSNTDSTWVQHIYNNEVTDNNFMQDFIGIASGGKNSFIHDNEVSRNKLMAASTTSDWVIGIYTPTATSFQSIYNNLIFNISSESNDATTMAGIMGFFIGNAAYSIYNNTVYMLTNKNGLLNGIRINQTECFVPNSGVDTDVATVSIYNNNIHTLSHQGVDAQVSGIHTRIFTLGTLDVHLYNNFISNLTASSSTNPRSLTGLYFQNGDVDASFNTVYFSGGNTPAAGFGTAGIFFDSTVNSLVLRNNLVVNQNASGTGGRAVALATNALAPYAALSGSSNYNSYYAGTGSQSFTFSDGTNHLATLAAYQSSIGMGRDANSIAAAVTFAGVDDPHTNDVAIKDKGISINNITTDIDNQIRSNPPDIGADEIINCAAFAISSTTTSATCETCADGTATVTVSGGGAPYAYDWSNGVTTQTAGNLQPGTYTVCVSDALGCSACDTVEVTSHVGLSNVDSDFALELFPNPSSDFVTVQFGHAVTNGKIEVTDVNGKLMVEQRIHNAQSTTLDISGLARQMYVVRVITGNSTVRKKLLVQ